MMISDLEEEPIDNLGKSFLHALAPRLESDILLRRPLANKTLQYNSNRCNSLQESFTSFENPNYNFVAYSN